MVCSVVSCNQQITNRGKAGVSSPPTARTPLAPSSPSKSLSASLAPPTRPSSCPPTSRPSGRGRVAPAARPWNGGAAGVIRARIVAVGRRRTVTCTYSQQLVLLYPTCCVFFASFCTTTPSCRAPAPATTTGTVATAAAGGTPAEALVATVPEPQHARQLHPNDPIGDMPLPALVAEGEEREGEGEEGEDVGPM